MKTIKLKSNLSEDEILQKMKGISDALREKGLLAKGDELVAGIEEEGDSIIVTINGDILDKSKYKELAKSFKQIGEVIANDLKNFDDNEDPMIHDDNEVEKNLMSPTEPTEPEVKSETPKSPEEKESKDKAVTDQAVKPAVETYHDTSELIITQNNTKKMSDLKTLLFSEEELKESKETPEVEDQKPEVKEHDDQKPEEPKAEPEKPAEEPEKPADEQKPEEKHFDEEKEVKFRVKCAKSGEVLKEGMIKVDAKSSDVESQAKVIEHLGGLKKDTVLEFFDEDEPEVKTFDDLYFSQEEIDASPKAEEPEVKEHDEQKPEEVKPEEAKPEEKPAEEVHHDEKPEDKKPEEPKAEPEAPKEEPKPEVKEHDEKPEEKKPEEVKPAEELEKPKEELHDAMKPEDKEAALKALVEYRKKMADGKSLSVAEKYFCDSMTKYFTEEEIKAAEAKVAPEVKPEVKPEEKKEPEAPKAEPEKPAVVESRKELVARLNAENAPKDLISLARKHKKEIKSIK